MLLFHEEDEDCTSPSIFTVRKVSVFSLLRKETKTLTSKRSFTSAAAQLCATLALIVVFLSDPEGHFAIWKQKQKRRGRLGRAIAYPARPVLLLLSFFFFVIWRVWARRGHVSLRIEMLVGSFPSSPVDSHSPDCRQMERSGTPCSSRSAESPMMDRHHDEKDPTHPKSTQTTTKKQTKRRTDFRVTKKSPA